MLPSLTVWVTIVQFLASMQNTKSIPCSSFQCLTRFLHLFYDDLTVFREILWTSGSPSCFELHLWANHSCISSAIYHSTLSKKKTWVENFHHMQFKSPWNHKRPHSETQLTLFSVSIKVTAHHLLFRSPWLQVKSGRAVNPEDHHEDQSHPSALRPGSCAAFLGHLQQ